MCSGASAGRAGERTPPRRYGYGKGGWFLQLMDGTSDVIVEHNTVFASKGILVADMARPPGNRSATAHTGFVLRSNILTHGSMGFGGAATLPGIGVLDHYFFRPVVERNVIIGGSPEMYPAQNFTVGTVDGVGFEDWARCRLELAEGTDYVGQATGGSAIGATPPPWMPQLCGEGGLTDIPWLTSTSS